MNSAKIDGELRRALKHGKGPFPILVRFRPPISDAEARALKLTGRGELRSGRATADQIEALSDRDDVVAVSLITQPTATKTRRGS